MILQQGPILATLTSVGGTGGSDTAAGQFSFITAEEHPNMVRLDAHDLPSAILDARRRLGDFAAAGPQSGAIIDAKHGLYSLILTFERSPDGVSVPFDLDRRVGEAPSVRFSDPLNGAAALVGINNFVVFDGAQSGIPQQTMNPAATR